MPDNIRKINKKGEWYYSLDDIMDLLEKAKSIEDLKSMLIPEKKPLSDFNQKLIQGLNFNPKKNKSEFMDWEQCNLKIQKYKHLEGKVFSSPTEQIKIKEIECIQHHTEKHFLIYAKYFSNKFNNPNEFRVAELSILQKKFNIPD
ncbi:hypothetical protein [Seonamhaeicola sp.]|uniref:hypothetical protein n=1 Tax=Seonamhaeicola sp. TaxID=1912245 RepID=UPI00260DC279|nr:hypothetical protein [Seonamhaeicola sp.]